jgi:hypothetical protein
MEDVGPLVSILEMLKKSRRGATEGRDVRESRIV